MDTKEGIARLMAAAEKLLMETSRLGRDVQTLNGRIQKFDDEFPPYKVTATPRKSFNVVDALNMINEARAHIINCEYELTIIRDRMDAIESNAVSREEMKPYIK